jgi:hypothetical protein
MSTQVRTETVARRRTSRDYTVRPAKRPVDYTKLRRTFMQQFKNTIAYLAR